MREAGSARTHALDDLAASERVGGDELNGVDNSRLAPRADLLTARLADIHGNPPNLNLTIGERVPQSQSGRPDSNRRPLVPQTNALTRLRHAPQRREP